MVTKQGNEEWERRLRAVEEAALVITAELSIDRVLQKIVDLARGIIGCQYAALGVLSDGGNGLSRFITSGLSQEAIGLMEHFPRGLGLLGALYLESRPLRVKRIADDPRSIGFPPHHPPMTSFLGVRITSKGNTLGNFYLTNKEGAEEFTQMDADLLEMFAAHAGVAIENARLYTQTSDLLQVKIREVERSERQSRFLVELGDLLFGTSLDDGVPFRQVAQKATEILGDATVLVRLDEDRIDGSTSKFAYHSDPVREKAANDFITENWQLISEIVLTKKESIFIPNAAAVVPPYRSIDPKSMLLHKFLGAIVVPIESRGEVFGAGVSLVSQPQTFTDSDFAFAQLIAERLGIAIENSRLYQDVKASLRLRDEFLSIASHELRSPVTSLKGYVQILLSDLNLTADIRHKALQVLDRQSNRLVELMDQLLDVSRIRVGRLELRLEETDLVDLASQIVRHFNVQLANDSRYSIVVETTAEKLVANCDTGRIEQVITNLISNAVKYSPGGGSITVHVGSDGGLVHVSVSDTGIGIPEEQQESLFEMFSRASNVKGKGFEGMGLGLYVCKEIIERHGGRIWVESKVGAGSTFHFTIPTNGPLKD